MPRLTHHTDKKVVVELSTENVLALMAKLYDENSKRGISKMMTGPQGADLVVTAVPNPEYYSTEIMDDPGIQYNNYVPEHQQLMRKINQLCIDHYKGHFD